MATTDHWFREAFTQHQAGCLERAEQLYRRVLRAQPRHVRALYLLGSLHAQRADYANALPWLDQALALDGTSVEAHNNHGVALKELGRWDEALESYDRALALRPTYAEAHNNRAVALHARGRLDEALAAYNAAQDFITAQNQFTPPATGADGTATETAPLFGDSTLDSIQSQLNAERRRGQHDPSGHRHHR